MKKIFFLILVLTFIIDANAQSQEMKKRLLSAIELLGGSCGSVDKYTELYGKIAVYCSNGANYYIKKDYTDPRGYKLEVR